MKWNQLDRTRRRGFYGREIFPSSPRRGVGAIKKKSRSILSSRRRGGVQPQQNSAEFDHHPVRSIKEASRCLLRSRPPLLGEEGKHPLAIWATAPKGHGYSLDGPLGLGFVTV